MFKTTIYLLRPFILFSALLLLTLFISRMVLALWQIERFENFSALLTLVIHGFRIDLSVLGYLLVLPAILHPWFMLSKYHKKWLIILKALFFFIFICVFFFELATPAFINEYGFRPNRLFIEYLPYPNEVFKMLVNGHLLTLVVVLLTLGLSAKYLGSYLNSVIHHKKQQHKVTILASG